MDNIPNKSHDSNKLIRVLYNATFQELKERKEDEEADRVIGQQRTYSQEFIDHCRQLFSWRIEQHKYFPSIDDE